MSLGLKHIEAIFCQNHLLTSPQVPRARDVAIFVLMITTTTTTTTTTTAMTTAMTGPIACALICPLPKQ